MTSFDFRLVLDPGDFDEAEVEALYARCQDGTLITAGGISYIDFDREADSLEEAVRSAIADVNAAGFRVARVEMDADNLALQQAAGP